MAKPRAGKYEPLYPAIHRFVSAALRDGSSPFTPDRAIWTSSTLDHLHRRLRLIPDLAFRYGGRVVGVGNVKYKRTAAVGVLHPDVYQVLAYAAAFDLEDAFLVYLAGEEGIEPGVHVIRRAGKRIHVLRLDLNVRPSEILEDVEELAMAIRTRVSPPHTASRRYVP